MQTVYFSAVFLESLLKYKDINWMLATCPFRLPFQPRLEKLIILLTFSSKLMCSFDSLMKGTWTKVLTWPFCWLIKMLTILMIYDSLFVILELVWPVHFKSYWSQQNFCCCLRFGKNLSKFVLFLNTTFSSLKISEIESCISRIKVLLQYRCRKIHYLEWKNVYVNNLTLLQWY